MPGGRPARRRGLPGLRLLVMTLALAVGACALVPTPWVGGWRLRTVGAAPAFDVATMVFTATDVVIQTGCNTGAGAYEVSGGHLTLKDVAFTPLTCEGPLAVQDAAFSALTSGSPSLSVSGDTLTIDAGAGAPVLVFDRTSGA
jgi:heat shock protein HslJ